MTPPSIRDVDQALLEQDEGEEQQADQNLRPPARQRAVEGDVGLDEALDEDADQRPGDEAGAAGQERAADDHGRDGVQLIALPCRILAKVYGLLESGEVVFLHNRPLSIHWSKAGCRGLETS